MNSYNENVSNFNQQKTAWENAIHLYKGPDPLEYWYHYVNWYEQNYCYDVSNKMPELLQKILGQFESYDVYKQDLRLVKIWMKYVDLQPNPLNLFQVLYQRTIGTQHSLFYISWANHYLRENGFKQAESVINLGFQAKAQPYEDLQSAQQQIASSYYHYTQQASNFQPPPAAAAAPQQPVVQNMQGYQQPPPAAPTVEYSAQNNYQPKEKRRNSSPIQENVHRSTTVKRQKYDETVNNYEAVPSYNYDQTAYNNGMYPANNNNNSGANNLNNGEMYGNSNGKDMNNYNNVSYDQQQPQVHQQGGGVSINSHQEQQPVENLVYQTSSSNPDCDLNDSAYVISSSLNYVYDGTNMTGLEHQSENENNETRVVSEPNSEDGIRIPVNFARSATNHQNPWRAPLYLEEPPDQNRYSMYAKNRIYPGWDSGTCDGTEFSFEELKAVKFKNKKLPVPEPEEVEDEDAVENDTYSEYWVDENQINGTDQEDQLQELTNHQYSSNQQSNFGSNRNNPANSQYIDEFSQFLNNQSTPSVQYTNQGSTSRKKSSKKQKSKKVSIQPINDLGGEEDEYEDDVEQSTIRYSCNQESPGLGAGDSKKITIKFKKEQKVPLNGKSKNGSVTNGYRENNGNNGHSSTSDAELLLSLNNNGNRGYYQENCYNDESSSDFNASYNSSYIGDNSNSAFNTEPSTPVMTYNNSHPTSRLNSAHSLAKMSPNYRYLNKHSTNVSLLNEDSMTMNDNSFFQAEADEELRSRRVQKATETIEQNLSKSLIDPFKAELCKAFLTKIGFPSQELCDVYRMVSNQIPKLSQTKQAYLGEFVYNIEKEVGRGAYGAVYKATNAYTGNAVAIKFQKPPNSWELYICNEVKKRITYHDILPGFMEITSAVMAPNGCVLISEFSPFGSLLDINNKIRQSTTRVMHESLVMHFTCQILDIVHYLHGCNIIHADIKPDNFLLMKVPNSSSHVPTLRLIDFGCAIDMNLFPEGTKFKKVIQTDGFTCTEMLEGRPWTFQTDLFCVAGTVHVMLFGDYMQVVKKFGVWDIKQKFPRYLKKNLWADFFGKLLNVKDADNMPNLLDLKAAIDSEMYNMDSELQKHIRTLSHMLLKR